MQLSNAATRLALRYSLIVVISLGATQCNVFRESGSRPASTAEKGDSALRGNIIQYARKYEGSKYTAAGKTPKTGFDCSGFTSYVMKEFDINLSPSAREQAKQGAKKSVKEARPGDLIFFRRGKNDPIFHVSLVVANNGKSLTVVHSTTSRGVIVEDIYKSPFWKDKVDSVRDVMSLKSR